MRKRRLAIYLLGLILTLLILGNPSEPRFLQAVADDFGAIHHGAEMTPAELSIIGMSSYRSYVLFSLYEYSFGTISVNYIGVGFMTFYQGSNTDTVPPKKEILQS